VAGGSSSIDHTILRDRDTGANGDLDERSYCICIHNWRNDVVALVTDAGEQVESVRYSAYGIPFGSPAGDADNDGDVNGSASTDDTDQIQTRISTSTYDVRGDLDLNGVVNIDDLTAAIANAGTITGWKDLTSDDVGNDKGYAGYEFDDVIQRRWSTWQVRNRVLSSNLGLWMQRDHPLFVAINNLYVYASVNPNLVVDVYGLECQQSGVVASFGSQADSLVDNEDCGYTCEGYLRQCVVAASEVVGFNCAPTVQNLLRAAAAVEEQCGCQCTNFSPLGWTVDADCPDYGDGQCTCIPTSVNLAAPKDIGSSNALCTATFQNAGGGLCDVTVEQDYFHMEYFLQGKCVQSKPKPLPKRSPGSLHPENTGNGSTLLTESRPIINSIRQPLTL
jgi:hypothetical protein